MSETVDRLAALWAATFYRAPIDPGRNYTMDRREGWGEAILAVLAALDKRGYLAGGPLESAHGSIIRIGHMGDLEPQHLDGLLAILKEILP